MGEPKLTPEQGDELARRYTAGASQQTLACEYGVSRDTIWKYATRRGVEMRAAGPRRRYTLNEGAFDVMTPAAAYWAGFLAADGCLYRNEKRSVAELRLALAMVDIAHVEKLRSFLETDRGITLREYSGYCPRQQSATLVINSSRLVERLMELRIKDFTRFATVELRQSPDFWRGVVDGDGSLSLGKDGTPTLYLCGQRGVVEAFLCFAQSLVAANCGIRPVSSIYCTALRGSTALAVIRVLYPEGCVALDRKAEMAARMLALPPGVGKGNWKRTPPVGGYDHERFRQLGLKGGAATRKKGPDYYQRISRMAVAKRRERAAGKP